MESTPLPVDDVAASYGDGHREARLRVKVVAPDGKTAVSSVTVRAYGVRGDGTVGPMGDGITDAKGYASLDLPPGDYCLSARTAPPEWLDLDIVTPPEPLTYQPVEKVYGPVVTAKYGYVPFSQDAFDRCYTKRPVRVWKYGSTEVVKMGSPFVVAPQIIDLDGEFLDGIDVYAVIPATAPWATTSDPEIGTAFFSMVDQTASPAEVGVSPGAPYAIEFQQEHGGFNITGTVKGMAGSGGGTAPLLVEAAPLMCRQTTRTFPAGNHGVDFLSANYGYHATLGLEPDLSTVALQLRHKGDGFVTVTFRTDLKHGRKTTTVKYGCVKGKCGWDQVWNSGGNHQTADVFHARQDGGVVKTTIVLSGIPANHRGILFGARSNHDAVPLPSRHDDWSSMFEVPQPDICRIEQSNDDKWGVADL
jgi:hypothetical protein